MKRVVLICAALLASTFALTMSASARLGIAPLTVQDDGVIEVGHGQGHGHGMHRGGRGHHYGWSRGRGHHRGWGHHYRY